MTDLSTLSDAQLSAMFNQRQQQPTSAQPPDLSKMSDAELRSLYEQRSGQQTVGGKLALGGRDVIEGLTQLPGSIYNLARLPVNAAVAGYNAVTGSNAPYARSAQENVSQALDAAGLPTAGTGTERMLSAVNRGGAAMLPAIATGGVMAGSANPTVAGAGQTLSAQPVSQIASGIGGDTGSQAAKEMGVGPAGQLAAGLAGSIAAPTALDLASRAIAPRVNEVVGQLVDKGVFPTYGQASNGGARASEDIAARLPGIGPKIQEAQERTVNQFATSAVNDALAPIGAKIKSEQTGNQAIAEAHKILSDEYKYVLGPVRAMPDAPFLSGVQAAAGQAPAESVPAIQAALKEHLTSSAGAPLTGTQLQSARRAFESLAYGTEDAATSNAYKGIADALSGLMQRAAPGSADALKTVDSAWANFLRVRNAATREAESGTFTPSNLAASSKTLDKFPKEVAYSEGRALMQPQAQQGLAVLGARPVASGEPALSLPQALAHPFALGGAWMRYPLYTPTGQELTARYLAAERPSYVRALADALRRAPGATTATAGLTSQTR